MERNINFVGHKCCEIIIFMSRLAFKAALLSPLENCNENSCDVRTYTAKCVIVNVTSVYLYIFVIFQVVTWDISDGCGVQLDLFSLNAAL